MKIVLGFLQTFWRYSDLKLTIFIVMDLSMEIIIIIA